MRDKSRSIVGGGGWRGLFFKARTERKCLCRVNRVNFVFICLLAFIQDRFKFSGLLLVVVTPSSPAQLPSYRSGEQGGGRQAGRLPLHLGRNEGLRGEYRCVHVINLSRAVPERFTAQDLD